MFWRLCPEFRGSRSHICFKISHVTRHTISLTLKLTNLWQVSNSVIGQFMYNHLQTVKITNHKLCFNIVWHVLLTLSTLEIHCMWLLCVHQYSNGRLLVTLAALLHVELFYNTSFHYYFCSDIKWKQHFFHVCVHCV